MFHHPVGVFPSSSLAVVDFLSGDTRLDVFVKDAVHVFFGRSSGQHIPKCHLRHWHVRTMRRTTIGLALTVLFRCWFTHIFRLCLTVQVSDARLVGLSLAALASASRKRLIWSRMESIESDVAVRAANLALQRTRLRCLLGPDLTIFAEAVYQMRVRALIPCAEQASAIDCQRVVVAGRAA